MNNFAKIVVVAACLKALLLEPGGWATMGALALSSLGVWLWESKLKPLWEEGATDA